MLYLILAICSSAAVSTAMRFSEKSVKNKMNMFLANYSVCLIMATAFMGTNPLKIFQSGTGNGLGTALLLGAVNGVLLLVNFIFLQKNMQYNGMVMSSTFMKLGVIVPTLMAITVFRESPTVLQLLGIGVAIGAILVIHFEKAEAEEIWEPKQDKKSWLVLLLIVSGFTDSMSNIYDKLGNGDLKEHFLFFTFIAAVLVTFYGKWRAKERFEKQDIVFGALIGIPNYLSSRFLLLALTEVPAVVTYPVYSVATIVVISVIGMIVFKEQMSRKKKLAVAMILLALGMLNL